MIASDFNLKTGNLENTKYVIPYRLEENQKILDIIYTALNLTTENTLEKYVFFDDFGKLSLKNIKTLTLPLILDCNQDALEYTYKTSIDSGVYNSIKISVNATKKTPSYTYKKEDSSSKDKWGRLQYFKNLNSTYTQAQARQYALNLLNEKNKLSESLEVIYLGNVNVRAGSVLNVNLGKKNIKSMIVTYCKHIIKGGEHTMQLTFTQL